MPYEPQVGDRVVCNTAPSEKIRSAVGTIVELNARGLGLIAVKRDDGVPGSGRNGEWVINKSDILSRIEAPEAKANRFEVAFHDLD